MYFGKTIASKHENKLKEDMDSALQLMAANKIIKYSKKWTVHWEQN